LSQNHLVEADEGEQYNVIGGVHIRKEVHRLMVRWKVVHEFSAGVDVQNPIVGYPSIGVSLYYNGNKLMRVEHELELDDNIEPDQVISTSRDDLKLFWELLQYRRGMSLPDIHRKVEKVQPADSSQPVGIGYKNIPTLFNLCLSVILPDPNVFSDTNNRLLVWLRLANDASGSDDAADAIRNYYMIWEDWHPSWKIRNGPTEATELKLVRDFVSHGEELRNCHVLDFIKRKLGKPIKQFDPTDIAQQQLVALQRTEARNFIEKELNKLL
jgi:hypothetical protein